MCIRDRVRPLTWVSLVLTRFSRLGVYSGNSRVRLSVVMARQAGSFTPSAPVSYTHLGLKVVTEFLPISARFIANKASYQFKHAEMDTMLEKLRAQLQNKEEAK